MKALAMILLASVSSGDVECTRGWIASHPSIVDTTTAYNERMREKLIPRTFRSDTDYAREVCMSGVTIERRKIAPDAPDFNMEA